jgi:hypothetical protein
MIGRATARYFIGVSIMLAAALAVGCGGSDEPSAPGLAQGRWGHTATLLEDGRVLVVGGQETPSRKLDTVEIFDPVTETWSAAASMAQKHSSGHRATLLTDGRVLVTGENDDGAAEIYDPATDQWASTTPMLQARTWASVTLLKDGMVLVAGGFDATKAGREELDTVEIFDPTSGEWTETNNMEQVHAGHSVAVLQDGRVLIVGKLLAELFDPSDNTWSATGPMDRERALGTTADLLPDGRVLVTGGQFQQGGYYGSIAPIRSAMVFDPSTGTWQSSESMYMSEPRENHPSVRFDDGRVMAIGDRETEIFDPTTNTWTSAGSLKKSHGTLSTAILLKDGRVLVVGGKEETDEGLRGTVAVEIYDPATGW